jgi:hypothetical protein
VQTLDSIYCKQTRYEYAPIQIIPRKESNEGLIKHGLVETISINRKRHESDFIEGKFDYKSRLEDKTQFFFIFSLRLLRLCVSLCLNKICTLK